MHVMRAGLRAILGPDMPGPFADWASVLDAVDAQEDLAPEIGEALRRIRRAWHAAGLLPADKYTEEEAETVLDAVTAFLDTVAATTPED
jgi:hypothetical protein